jgi:hypothetical protein
MPDVTNEREGETTNDPQGKTKLEARDQEKPNHVTGKFTRLRSPKPEKQKKTDPQPAAATVCTRQE